MESTDKKFTQLVNLMVQLRSPEGCPWDREQSHQSLKKYMIEEAYEACDAIDSGEDELLKEELGDVLLQVVFHAQIASEQNRFTVSDVLETINAKLVNRHPHVFGDLNLDNSEEVLQHWESFKVKEKQERKSILDGVPGTLPSLLKADRIQERVSRVGFDWDKVEDVIEKLKEELGEFEEACTQEDSQQIEEELGDLLFALVNVARFVKTDPEAALHGTIQKFTRRFHYVEQKIKESGQDLQQASLEMMDRYWEESKQRET